MIREFLYSDLEQLILKLGFLAIPTGGNHKVFRHQSSEALIILPNYQDKDYVNLVHLMAVRRILQEYGLMDEIAFDNFLFKVPS